MTEIDDGSQTLSRGDGLADQAYTVLREAILTNTITPGTRLSVPEVARRLSISRSPAREAITRIQHDGLADFSPYRGAVVTRIDPDALREIYELREVLEGLAARLAARSASRDVVDGLEETWSRHAEAVAAGDEETHVRLDGDFHATIRTAAGNSRVADALDRLQGQIRLAMATTAHRGGGMSAAVAEHRAILDAVAAGDEEAAERTARDHVRRLRENLLAAPDADGTATS